MGQVFPDPEENPEEFTNLSMWPGFANGDSICYRNLLQQYKIDKQEGKWDSFKPLDLKAEVQQMRHDQSRLLQMVEKSMRKEQVEPPKVQGSTFIYTDGPRIFNLSDV
ncbi:hypothetical protein CYMTET_12302, partial [Cymbomonas tetramitiformis]